MNVYDFDRTVYQGDATVDYYIYCLKRQPSLLWFLPRQLWSFAKVKANAKDLTAAKEGFFSFLPAVKNPEETLFSFWEKHFAKIEPWYLAQKQPTDLIISASPEFLLAPACRKLGVLLIASRVDPKTGRYNGKNCAGAEKVRRFQEAMPGKKAARFYSDSRSDWPMAAFAAEGFYVRKGKISPWPEHFAEKGQTVE